MANVTHQETRLRSLEKDVRQGFHAASDALLTIKEEQLYRLHYKTFDDYLRERWNLTRQHANRLAKAAEFRRRLKTSAPALPPPGSEGASRPFTRLPEDDQAVAYEAAVEEWGGPPTGAQAQATIHRLYGEDAALPAPPTVEEAKVTAETEDRTPKQPHPKKDERKDPHSEAVRELAKIKKGVDHIISILYTFKDKDSLKALNLNVVNNLIEVPPDFFNIPINGHSFTLDEFRSRWHTCCDRLLTTLRSTHYVADDPPALEDVLEYAGAEGLDADEAERFYHHHASTGWRAGRKWMTDWKAGLRFWLSNAAKFSNGQPAQADDWKPLEPGVFV